MAGTEALGGHGGADGGGLGGGNVGDVCCRGETGGRRLPVSGVTSLLIAAGSSVLVFRERRTPALYATVGLAVAAIVLVNVGR